MRGKAREPLGLVAIAGDGPVGLAAAIALRRALPRCEVILVATPPDPAALADHSPSLPPHCHAFLRQIGIDDEGLAARAGSCPRLGTQMLGWAGAASASLLHYGAAPKDAPAALAVATAVAGAGRFALPSDDPVSPLSDLDYGLRVSPQAYRRHLSSLAAHLGVARRTSGIAAAVPNAAGEIAVLQLADGEKIAADLYIDCSGPAAQLAKALPDQAREDWSRILPCDRLLLPKAPDAPHLSPVDRVTATPFGWRGEIFGRDGTHRMFAASSAVGSPRDWADAAGFEPASAIAIMPGRRTRLWQSNLVSLGDAAAQFEPLHALAPALAFAQIALLIDLLPGRDLQPLERDEFNRRAGAMADRVRDFIALHYCTGEKTEGPFLGHAARLERPDSLQLTLSEYTRRGRLPFFEEDIMTRDAWIFAMASINRAPGPSPRLLAAAPSSRAAVAGMQKARAEAAVALAQPYPQWLAGYLKGLQ